MRKKYKYFSKWIFVGLLDAKQQEPADPWYQRYLCKEWRWNGSISENRDSFCYATFFENSFCATAFALYDAPNRKTPFAILPFIRNKTIDIGDSTCIDKYSMNVKDIYVPIIKRRGRPPKLKLDFDDDDDDDDDNYYDNHEN